MPYLRWTLFIKETDFTRHEFQYGKNNKKVKFTIYHSFGINHQEMATTLPAVYTQGAEVNILFTVIKEVRTINKLLEKESIPKIKLSFNQDNFGISMPYAHLLIYLVLKGYNDLNTMELNNEITGILDTKKHKIICRGNKLIKH